MAALREAREAAGLSQENLSARLKRTKNFVYTIEARQRMLNIFEFVEYCRAIDLDPHELMKRLFR